MPRGRIRIHWGVRGRTFNKCLGSIASCIIYCRVQENPCDISDQAQSLSGIQHDDAVRGEVDNQKSTEQEEPEEAQKGDTTSTEQWHSVRTRKTSANRRFVKWGLDTNAKSTDG